MQNQMGLKLEDEATSNRKRIEKLLVEFEKIESKEQRKKNTTKRTFQKKYARSYKGCIFVKKIAGEHIHLSYKNGENFGAIHTNPSITNLLRVNDGLEGLFGFRDEYWRVQFLISILSATEESKPQTPRDQDN